MRLPLSPEEALAFLRAIETATATDDLVALRKDLRLAYAPDERLEFLELMFSVRTLQLERTPPPRKRELPAAG